MAAGEYDEHFEEEKMENQPEEEKANQQEVDKELVPQHYNIEQFEQDYVEDYEN